MNIINRSGSLMVGLALISGVAELLIALVITVFDPKFQDPHRIFLRAGAVSILWFVVGICLMLCATEGGSDVRIDK